MKENGKKKREDYGDATSIVDLFATYVHFISPSNFLSHFLMDKL